MSRDPFRELDEFLEEESVSRLSLLLLFDWDHGLMFIGLEPRPAWVCNCRNEGELILEAMCVRTVCMSALKDKTKESESSASCRNYDCLQ